MMLDCNLVSIATIASNGVYADVNAAAIHALGLLIAHTAHLLALNSERRHNAARSGFSNVPLHTLAHTKHHVFWAIMQVLTYLDGLPWCHC